MPTIRRLDAPLTSAARSHPRRPAVAWAGGSLSYEELHERATAAASDTPHLLTVGDPAGPGFATRLHAAWLAGAAVRPVAPGRWDREPPVPDPLPAGTLALLHTSGTTGEPRPVCLTRANFEASARASNALLDLGPADRWLCCLPVDHVAGFSIFTRCVFYGACVHAAQFDPARVRDLLEAGEVTLASLVPTMLERLRGAGFERAPALRGILLGGGPIPDELFDWATAAGLPVMPTYGMTETTSQVATARPGERLAEVLPGVELRVSEEGEILVRGPMVAADGWLRTGDRGRLAPDGRLEVEGRIDDVIVTGGENVAAREVEAAVRRHPGVRDAAVLGIEDGEWGKAVTAFVTGEVTEKEVIAHCRASLAGFKVPKRVLVLDELPRTASGKVMRAALESRADDLRQRR